MRTEAALLRDKELLRERKRRLFLRYPQHPLLPHILKLREAGRTCREIGQALHRDSSTIACILRAAKAAALTRFSDMEGA